MGRKKQPRIDRFVTSTANAAENRAAQDEAATRVGLRRQLKLMQGGEATVTVHPYRHPRSVAYYIRMVWRLPGTRKRRTLNLSPVVPGERPEQIAHGWSLIAKHDLLDQFNHDAFKDWRDDQYRMKH